MPLQTSFGLLLVVLFISTSTGCISRHNKDHRLLVNHPIEDAGVYTNAAMNLRLTVRGVDHIIEFSLADTTGRRYCDDIKPRASTYMRWYFVADSTGSIWFYSADIGSFIPQHHGNRSYSWLVVNTVGYLQYTANMRQALPAVLQKDF